jgi:TonB family protein
MSILKTMLLKTTVPKPGNTFAPQLRRILPDDRRQRGLMIGSLCLLVLALGIVLWHNRDFWFEDSDPIEAGIDQPVESQPPSKGQPATQPKSLAKAEPVGKSKHKTSHRIVRRKITTAVVAENATPVAPESLPGIVATDRKVLPPLDVEVVAGNTHRVIRPGNNSLHVDIQPDSEPQPSPEIREAEPAATVTSNAAERVAMSSDASELVTKSVKPTYPMLARQMKVQGSVILQALIGRDGIIQNLHVVSGPQILASAAEDAVRQWHFRPHIEGAEAVETEAKITVNFTISTN